MTEEILKQINHSAKQGRKIDFMLVSGSVFRSINKKWKGHCMASKLRGQKLPPLKQAVY